MQYRDIKTVRHYLLLRENRNFLTLYALKCNLSAFSYHTYAVQRVSATVHKSVDE